MYLGTCKDKNVSLSTSAVFSLLVKTGARYYKIGNHSYIAKQIQKFL
jgi:hypothetical protein